MDNKELINRVSAVLNEFVKNESYLLANDLSEQSITHKLAEYLQPLFPKYHVDCEYNGNALHGSGKKKIDVLTQELIDMGIPLNKKDEIEKEFCERAVFPDIIIHKRSVNIHNLCVFEVKKDSSRVDKKYDHLKLTRYTQPRDYPDDLSALAYQLGIFILFKTKKFQETQAFELEFFENGECVRGFNNDSHS